MSGRGLGAHDVRVDMWPAATERHLVMRRLLWRPAPRCPRFSQQQRSAVFLTYWLGLSPSEIADELGVSDGTIRKQLARARARLREELR